MTHILFLPTIGNLDKAYAWLKTNALSIKPIVDPTICVLFDHSETNGIANQGDITVFDFDVACPATMQDLLKTPVNRFGNCFTNCIINGKACSFIVLDNSSTPTPADITALKAQLPFV